MISVRLVGGLGNQMFIYAFAKALEQKGYRVCLCASLYDELQLEFLPNLQGCKDIRNLEISSFDLSLPLAFRFEEKFREYGQPSMFMEIARKICRTQMMGEYFPRFAKLLKHICRFYSLKFGKIFDESDPFFKSDNFLLSVQSLKPNLHLLGYFQNLEYFREIRNILIDEFKLKRPLSKHNLLLKQTIAKTPNSCFLHVRRGDYLIEQHWRFVELGSTYYENAIQEMKKWINNPVFFVFSNDIQWCRQYFLQNLSPAVLDGVSFHFVDQNGEGNAIEEMELMRACKNGIIANSTFSWWGAYLMDNPHKIIISPPRFHYDESIVEKLIPCDDENGKWIAMNFIWKEAGLEAKGE